MQGNPQAANSLHFSFCTLHSLSRFVDIVMYVCVNIISFMSLLYPIIMLCHIKYRIAQHETSVFTVSYRAYIICEVVMSEACQSISSINNYNRK